MEWKQKMNNLIACVSVQSVGVTMLNACYLLKLMISAVQLGCIDS